MKRQLKVPFRIAMADSLAFSLLCFGASRTRRRLIRKTHRIMAVQEQFLQKLLRTHETTVLGQQLQLHNIRSVEDFRQRVPIYPYEFYVPYIDRITQGETHVLSPSPVVYINLTNRSIQRKKQVPVTQHFLQTQRQATLASAGCAIASLKQSHRSFGKALFTHSAKLRGINPAGIPYGSTSAGRIHQEEPLMRPLSSFPLEALRISEPLTRQYVCLLFALRDQNLKGWTANFPMLILQTCHLLERYAEELIEDLRQGTIAPWLKIDTPIRDALEQQWSADESRAIYLKTVLHQNGRLTPQTAWPQLSYVTTARGGTSDFYRQRFPDFFGEIPVFGGIYSVAEATLSICPEVNCDGGILALESGFFEFVPVDQWNCDQPNTLLPHELTVGDRYRVLVTNYNGFYRYDIGDVVEVVGFYNQSPLIVFRHRYGESLSATIEQTTEYHVTQVIKNLQQEFDIRLEDFCITLSDDDFLARYVIHIELAEGHKLPDPIAFLKRFDYWLGQINTAYGVARQDQLPPPYLRVLPRCSFEAIRQRQVSRGMFDSHLRIPHISEDHGFLTEIPAEIEINLSKLSLLPRCWRG